MKESIYFGSASHVGVVRKENQDSVCVGKNQFGQTFAIVCDGLGGYRGGEIASNLVMQLFKQAFLTTDFSNMNEFEIKDWFEKNLQTSKYELHKKIDNYHSQKNDHSIDQMATTIVCSLIIHGKVYTFWVGDSRAYLVDVNKDSWQITRDHNLYNYLLDKKVDKESIDQNSGNLLALTNIVGGNLEVEKNTHLDVEKFGCNVNEIADNLFVLLCSDGFYNFVDPHEYYWLITDNVKRMDGNLVLVAGELLKIGMQRLSNDNLSVVIISLKNT